MVIDGDWWGWRLMGMEVDRDGDWEGWKLIGVEIDGGMEIDEDGG